MSLEDEVNSSLPERLQKTSLRPPTIAFVNKDVRAYFKQPQVDDKNALFPIPWNLKPEIPTSDEILGSEDEFVDLMPNRIVGPWDSKDSYLKAHYELLREDAVAPLRDAVAIFRNNPDMNDDKKVSIYEKAYVVGLTFAPRGLAFHIRFSTNRAGKRIVWDYSKRLITGSMIAMSPAADAFKTKCVVAIVAARPLTAVKAHPPEVDIYFANPADTDFDPQLEWVMVGAKEGYYEASRHTMAALQKMSREKFALAEQLCFLNPETDPPQYVTENPRVEIETTILDSKEEEGRVDLLSGWPRSPIGDLDATQWTALEQMLTKQLAIIQGPPGTGKTYISVIALRIILSNMKLGDPPVVVASQTNHALDQILTLVSQFERQYVRLGARSSDENIKKRTLFAVRREEGPPNLTGGLLSGAYKASKTLVHRILDIIEPFKLSSSDQPLTSVVLKKHGLLSERQCDFLEKGAKRWVFAEGDDKEKGPDPLTAWLGDQVTAFEVYYADEKFGFAEDEEDLEYEQLKDLEAEQGLNDEEEYEMLKGIFVPLQEGFIVSTSVNRTTGRSGYLKLDDLWKIPVKERGQVYSQLRQQFKDKLLREFRSLAAQYAENSRKMQIGGWEKDHNILRNIKVLGMTTTGLSKYRGLVSSLKPRVVLIEEAAEAIEGPIAAACLDSLQQLILVGDHLQLRGHCSVQDLEGEPFHLDMSMFERLVKNGMRYVTLQRQRRMAPEIRQLLSPIYEALQDHESVKNHKPVQGMGNLRLFFFSHDWPESFDEMASKYNDKEAEMIAEFFTYLVLNDIPVKDITVLTFYNGQRKKILRLMRQHSYLQGHYIKVVTVDSYQGEENEIVLLSLVRNGRQGIGFLSIANRVCVALSRARRGFYMFGNADLLASTDNLWANVLSELRKKGHRIGNGLPLTCEKHSNKLIIKDPADWKRSNGGCELACGERLACGHKCTVRCHSFSHDQIQCNETCGRRMECSHICEIPCLTTHDCSCDCEESRRLKALAQVQSCGGGADLIMLDFESEDTRVEDERRAAVESYQAYAKGGSKEHDAVLERLAMAESQQRKQPMLLDLLDWQTLQGGDDPVDGATPRQSQTGFGALGDGERGGYLNQARPSTEPERSLLD
ncbi:P-loop containing nucleoside triphosphate hydrolase protein [Aspergillus karnatakaensis]|uniref:putative DEAD box helicase involved in nonsense mediated decay n=1 Tax=Aspergillus karnatakaensis TaxID=1810916 RepID=UPI003CCDB268